MQERRKPCLDIVIVNWNAGKQLRDCVQSIKSTNKDKFQLKQIIVVDNNSSDGSLEIIENASHDVNILRNKKNRGFATACNQGAAVGTAEYILFLNPDTKLFKSSLQEPIRFMESENAENVGITGIQLRKEEKITRTCSRFPSPPRLFAEIFGLDKIAPSLGRKMEEWDHKESKEVDQVMGAFFFLRRSLFESLDGFDEQFFVYFEEVDFARRAKRKGWKSYYLTTTCAFHEGGGTSSQVKDKRLFYSLRSRLLYGFKHFHWLNATIILVLTLTVELFTRILWGIYSGSASDVMNTIRGFFLLWKETPKLLKHLFQAKSR